MELSEAKILLEREEQARLVAAQAAIDEICEQHNVALRVMSSITNDGRLQSQIILVPS